MYQYITYSKRPLLIIAETNIEGHFTVTNQLGGPVHLSLFPVRRSGYRISKVQMADMFLFPSDFPSSRGVVFAISPDAQHEDIQVVLKQPQIRVKVLNSDGTALANATISCDIRIESKEGYSTSEETVDTDENGYFVHYSDEIIGNNKTFVYKITATYENQKASLGPYEFKSTGRTHDVVLIFGEEQVPTSQLQNDSSTNSPAQISPSNQNDRPSPSILPQQTSILSGRVVDVKGKPVADLPVFMRSVQVSDSRIRISSFSALDVLKSQHSQTDIDGSFTINNIPSGVTYFSMLPNNINTFLPEGLAEKLRGALDRKEINTLRSTDFFEREQDDFEPDYEVLSISRQGITIYPHIDSDPIIFGIHPGKHSKDVVVTVKQRMRIRGQLLNEDRTPVANTRINLRESRYTEDGKGGGGSSGGNPKTDAEGYFIYYPEEEHDPRYYVFGLRYKGMVAESEPILLKPGERYEELTLILKSIQ